MKTKFLALALLLISTQSDAMLRRAFSTGTSPFDVAFKSCVGRPLSIHIGEQTFSGTLFKATDTHVFLHSPTRVFTISREGITAISMPVAQPQKPEAKTAEEIMRDDYLKGNWDDSDRVGLADLSSSRFWNNPYLFESDDESPQ